MGLNGGPTGNRTPTLCLQGRSANHYHYQPILALRLASRAWILSSFLLTSMVPHEGLEPYISALKGRRAYLYTNGAYKVIDYCELAVYQRGTFLYWVMYPVLAYAS